VQPIVVSAGSTAVVSGNRIERFPAADAACALGDASRQLVSLRDSSCRRTRTGSLHSRSHIHQRHFDVFEHPIARRGSATTSATAVHAPKRVDRRLPRRTRLRFDRYRVERRLLGAFSGDSLELIVFQL